MRKRQPSEAAIHIDGLRKLCSAHKGSRVRVRGMWTGDFEGIVTAVRFGSADFQVEMPLADSDTSCKIGQTVGLPFSPFMSIELLGTG